MGAVCFCGGAIEVVNELRSRVAERRGVRVTVFYPNLYGWGQEDGVGGPEAGAAIFVNGSPGGAGVRVQTGEPKDAISMRHRRHFLDYNVG